MPDLKRIRVIVNPSAASGQAWKHLRNAGLTTAATPGFELRWVESKSPADLKEQVALAQDEDLHALALAGGDGSVTMALQALQPDNRVPIAILPVGSGNDFAKDCGIPRDLAGSFRTLLEGVPRRVDVATCLPSGQRYCCVAAVGLDEMALRIIYKSRWRRSKGLNMAAALRSLAVYLPRPVRVTWLGGQFEGEVMFAAVTNTTSYGGGFMVSPEAKVDDGLLDLCIVRRTGRLRLIGSFPRILKGTHGGMAEVTMARSPWVRIEALDGPLPVPLDGELDLAASPVELRCEPRALSILVPRAGVSRTAAPAAEVRLAS